MTAKQAKEFYEKFWDLHVDWRNAALRGKNGAVSDQQPEPQSTESPASEAESSDGDQRPFQERIRPGMAVCWRSPADFPVRSQWKNLAIVLCPQHAAGKYACDYMGNKVNPSRASVRNGDQSSDSVQVQRYLCAMVHSASEKDTYQVSLLDHVLVDVEQMEAEVMLKYNPHTRYYYIPEAPCE